MASLREIITTFSAKVDKSSLRGADRAMNSLKRAAISLGAAFAAVNVGQAAKSTIESASDIQETLDLMTESFGPLTQKTLEWAKTTSRAVGRSEFEMREHAASIQALIEPTLGINETSAELSTTLSRLAIDLGSAFNAMDPQVLAAIRSGLRGQSEPLTNFGVDLSVAALQQQLLSEGSNATVLSLSRQEKVMVRYRAILAQTTRSQGNAVRTADGYANATKAIAGAVNDIQGKIGLFFLPAVERYVLKVRKASRATLDWLDANEKLFKAKVDAFLKRATGVLDNFIAGLKVLLALPVTKFIGAMLALRTALRVLSANPIILIATAIALLVEDIGAFNRGADSMIGRFLDIEISGTRMGDILTDAFDAIKNSVSGFMTGLKALLAIPAVQGILLVASAAGAAALAVMGVQKALIAAKVAMVALAANPLGAALALISAGLVFIIQDVGKFLEGKDSLLGAFLDMEIAGKRVGDILTFIFEGATKAIGKAVDAIKSFIGLTPERGAQFATALAGGGPGGFAALSAPQSVATPGAAGGGGGGPGAGTVNVVVNAGNADAAQTAKLVRAEVTRANEDTMRRARQAITP